MGLFDKKNKGSKKKRPTKNKSGFSSGDGGFNQMADSTEQSFGNMNHDFHDAIQQNEKQAKGGRRRKKQKSKKSGGGFLGFLKGKKKKQNQERGLGDDGFDLSMQNNAHANGFDYQSSQGMETPVNDQFDDLFPNSNSGNSTSMNNDPMSSIPMDNSAFPSAGFEDSRFGNDGLDEGAPKKGLFGKKKSKKPKGSLLDKSNKKKGRKKSANNASLLKMFAVVLLLLIGLGIAALFLLDSGMGGKISGTSNSAVSVVDESTANKQVSQQAVTKPAGDPSGLESEQSSQNANTADGSTTSSDASNTQSENGQPTVVEANADASKKPETNPASKEPATTEQAPVPANGEAKKVEQAKEEQPVASKPKEDPNKPIAINTADKQIESAISKKSDDKPVGKLSYDDFLNEATTTIYREE